MQYGDSEQYTKTIEIDSNSSIVITGKLSYRFWYYTLEYAFEFSAVFHSWEQDSSIVLLTNNRIGKYGDFMTVSSFDEISPRMIDDFKSIFSKIIEDIEPVANSLKEFHAKQ